MKKFTKQLFTIMLAITMTATPTMASVMTETVHAAKAKYSAKYFKRMGVVRWGGYKWTWYSQRVLPGRGLKIPGRHVDKHGYIVDKKGYIVLAHKTLKKGKIVKTPFGKKGKIYDRCPSRGIMDVYVDRLH